MRPVPQKADDLDLDLPALDGEGDAPVDVMVPDDLGFLPEDGLGDAFDDATGEGDPHESLVVDGAEVGWLDDSDTAGGLDVGPFDVAIEAEGRVLEDDEADGRTDGLGDLIGTDEVFVADGGEEGPLAADEELREEDLPALDADEDGDVPDELLLDRAPLGSDDELRWDDRAWERVTPSVAPGVTSADDGDDGLLALPGEDPSQATRDATWRRLEDTGRAMAAAFVPAGSVVVALSSPDRSRAVLVRVRPDGEARIIAEVEPRASKDNDEGETCIVNVLRWDAARNCLFVGGSFGVEAYRPG